MDSTTTTIQDVHRALKKLIPNNAIICGQSLGSDFKALQVNCLPFLSYFVLFLIIFTSLYILFSLSFLSLSFLFYLCSLSSPLFFSTFSLSFLSLHLSLLFSFSLFSFFFLFTFELPSSKLSTPKIHLLNITIFFLFK